MDVGANARHRTRASRSLRLLPARALRGGAIDFFSPSRRSRRADSHVTVFDAPPGPRTDDPSLPDPQRIRTRASSRGTVSAATEVGTVSTTISRRASSVAV